MSRLSRFAVLIIIAAFTLASCDGLFSVENPGPIDEEALNDPDAVPGLVTGMSSDFSLGYRVATYWGGVWADEHTHSGTFSAPTIFSRGELPPADIDPWYQTAQQARWVAEDGLERMQEVLGDEFNNSEETARAYLFAGYSNRTLGENTCRAVSDGGEPQSFEAHFERALDHFRDAEDVASQVGRSDLESAALAGQASVLAALGDWEEAHSTAEEVAIGFQHEAIYSNNSSRENNNWPGNTIERGEYSVYDTVWEGVDDPRLPQRVVTTAGGDTATAADGSTPWITQLKHETDADNIALSKGTEMRLISAEYMLRDQGADGIDAALELINEVREFHDIPEEVTANNLEEAWSTLQIERGKELWLEGRRFWDLRRWHDEGPDSPAYHDYLEGRDTCVPIGQSEQSTNPNI